MNPWNEYVELCIPEEIKKTVIDWFNVVQSQRCYGNQGVKVDERTKFIELNPLDSEAYTYVKNLYDGGYGYKLIARALGLSYTLTRKLLINFMKIEVRKGTNVTTDKLREIRSDRVKGKKNPFYNWPETKPDMVKKEQGLNGYYIATNGKAYWLRSSWEYVYAKWLDRNRINWKLNVKSYTLSNGETYLPDFIIYNDDGTFFFVEVKGTRYKHRAYKVQMLRDLGYDVVLIDNILPYTTDMKGDVAEWRRIRLSRKELNVSE